jgi:hypothetical protein
MLRVREEEMGLADWVIVGGGRVQDLRPIGKCLWVDSTRRKARAAVALGAGFFSMKLQDLLKGAQEWKRNAQVQK